MEPAVKEVFVRRLEGAEATGGQDFLAAEEPLEIRVDGHSVAVVMRTPGEDRELAAGFVVTEGIARRAADIVDITRGRECETNVIDVLLTESGALDLGRLTRHVFSSSSCGICGKATIESIQGQFPPLDDKTRVEAKVLLALPGRLAAAQAAFQRTGGLHACALFDAGGNLLALREDVGRHNALDKVIGWALRRDMLPLRGRIALLSGRASFEMMQKALAAGISIVAAISAPSSLAVEFAEANGQTLAGFVRGTRMNIYAGAERIVSTR